MLGADAKNILLNALWGGLAGLFLHFFLWRRKKESDRNGLPCLRYQGPRYGFLLTTCLCLWAGIHELEKHDCNGSVGLTLFFILGTISALIWIYHASYRITLTQNEIIRLLWPFSPCTFLTDNLIFIGQKKRNTTLHFNNGDQLTIQWHLSGQEDFLARLQQIMLTKSQPTFHRPTSARSKTKKK